MPDAQSHEGRAAMQAAFDALNPPEGNGHGAGGAAMSGRWRIEKSGYTSLVGLIGEDDETIAVGVLKHHAQQIVADHNAVARLAAVEAENARLRRIEAAARAYDEFVLLHGVLVIERSQPLSARRHLLHKWLHDALAETTTVTEEQQ